MLCSTNCNDVSLYRDHCEATSALVVVSFFNLGDYWNHCYLEPLYEKRIAYLVLVAIIIHYHCSSNEQGISHDLRGTNVRSRFNNF